MDKQFANRIEEYLSSECSDYSLTYTWEWNTDTECCEVAVKRDDHTQSKKELNFKYRKKEDDLEIELSEDSFYVTREYDSSVKYFWMLVSPSLFPDA